MLISQQNKQLAPTAGDDASQSTTSTKIAIPPASKSKLKDMAAAMEEGFGEANWSTDRVHSLSRRAWGIICLSLAFSWQLYTIWLLVHLHESDSGTRYSRYLDLAMTAFGQKLGKFSSLVPVMYLAAGTCVQLIIIGGGTLKLFITTVCKDGATCDAKSLTTVECFLVFMIMAVVLWLNFPT
ncbi:lysine histidine transporter-like 8 [Prunus yedoensis var. nudiflora]|uniref:Lysine histidine transporter-like 8 n=1 Tax=Prunus yedoensis var. nudiflora TaxID=2094558 RepID=A0A314Z7C2_PRUYE|nr:lysine histidine transporter-like 8 [Prunus yedoensis var. nudiflora]